MNCPPVFALGNVIGFSHFLQFSEAQEQVGRQHAVLHGPDTVLVLRRGGLSGKYVRGELHIQNVNNRHSRIKGFIGVRRRIATKYLASYLRWYHLIVLQKSPTPRLCLGSAMSVNAKREQGDFFGTYTPITELT